MSSSSPAEAYRQLVRQARLLVAAERECGVIDVPAAPAVQDAPSEASAVPPQVAVAVPPIAPPAAPAVAPRTIRATPPVVPQAILDAFGDLPSRVAACTACRLCEGRTHAVFGEGSPRARLVFCGEGPGFEEDRSGRPFVGRAGELLTAMIEKGLRMRREDVFILNAVKCRPPENRTPALDEIAACRPHLEAQLAVIAPAVIVALGNASVRALLGDVGGITRIRGRVFDGFGAKVVPSFHPAYLLRNPDAKRESWEDLKTVLRLLPDSADGASAPSG